MGYSYFVSYVLDEGDKSTFGNIIADMSVKINNVQAILALSSHIKNETHKQHELSVDTKVIIISFQEL